MTEALKAAIDKIQIKGFPYIKVELEADLGRDEGREQECSNCDGRGYSECNNCDGTGAVTDFIEQVNGAEEPAVSECYDCLGEGNSDCDECAGRGYFTGDWDTESCEQFIIDQ